MKAFRVVLPLCLSIGLAIEIEGMPTAAQTNSPKDAQPPEPGLRKLTAGDEKRATQLDEQIDKALDADRWDEAVARAEELFTLRTQAQGPKHFETVDAEWRRKTLRRVARLPRDDRVAYKSAISIHKQGMTDNGQGKYAQAQPLFEQALEIFRRLLSDDNPETAACYNDLAVNLNAQGSMRWPSRSLRRPSKSAAVCSPTTTPRLPPPTTTWRRI